MQPMTAWLTVMEKAHINLFRFVAVSHQLTKEFGELIQGATDENACMFAWGREELDIELPFSVVGSAVLILIGP